MGEKKKKIWWGEFKANGEHGVPSRSVLRGSWRREGHSRWFLDLIFSESQVYGARVE